MTAIRALRWGVAAGPVVALVAAGALEGVELAALNHLFELRGARPPLTPIVIATIDELDLSTRSSTKGRFLMRRLGAVGVRGRALPVRIWGVPPRDMRYHPRAVLCADGTATVTDASGSRAVRVRDLGAGGIEVLGLPERVPAGTSVRVQYAGDAAPQPITAAGAVGWREEAAAGIAFAGLPPETEAWIAAYVRQKSL